MKNRISVIWLAGVMAIAPSLIQVAHSADDKKASVATPAKQTIVVRNKDGKPIENAAITPEYNSLKPPTTYKTDADGKVELTIEKGLFGLKVKAAGIDMVVRGKIEWPCVLTLPTSKTKE